jgi:hypothetical protein
LCTLLLIIKQAGHRLTDAGSINDVSGNRCFEAPAIENTDAVADLDHFVQVGRDHEDRFACVAQCGQPVPNLALGANVKPSRRVHGNDKIGIT